MNKSESKYFNTALKMDKAMIKLLEKKDFEYITIKEICDEAGVNRSTFYLHYNNTSDLLAETGSYLKNKFLSYFSTNIENIKKENLISKFHICELSELDFITEEYLEPFLTYFYENRRVLFTILSHQDLFRCDNTFENLFEHIFNPILSRFQYPEIYRKYVMVFYLNGIMAIVTEWLRGDCKESISEISKIIKFCVHGLNLDFEHSLNKRTEKGRKI